MEEAEWTVNSEEAEGEARRRKALSDADPVNLLWLSAFAKQQLDAAAGVHGPALNAALGALDPTLAEQRSLRGGALGSSSAPQAGGQPRSCRAT